MAFPSLCLQPSATPCKNLAYLPLHSGGAFIYFFICLFVKCLLANTVLALELRGVEAP